MSTARTFTLVNGSWVIPKGDDEALDYGIDYADLLEDGETISASTWTVAVGLTAGATGVIGSVAFQWLSGGAAGESYDVDNIVTTSVGRIFERSFRVQVVARR